MDNSTMTRELKDQEIYFKISDSNQLRPFFMSIVSDANHWLFVSSNGGLTAGRKNSDFALFPYYTDDKVTESKETAGPKTIIRCQFENQNHIWEPFVDELHNPYNCTRNLYKSELGNKVIFEEINHDLQLTFCYKWSSSAKFGFVRTAEITNLSKDVISIEILDGLQNIMPNGIPSDLQNAYSNLVNAYKRSELHVESGLGIFALSAIIVDRAEPSESLKANTVWSLGLDNPTYLLSSKQIESYKLGGEVNQELDVKGKRGAYMVSSSFKIESESSKKWHIVADVNKDQSNVARLIQSLCNNAKLEAELLEDIELGTKKLISLIAAADGLQCTSDHLKNARHQSNVLFNIMRGGIFDDNYLIEKEDFLLYLQKANKELSKKYASDFNTLNDTFTYQELLAFIEKNDNVSLYRLTTEYLPLKFSRRHGDPSRPWNKFSINTMDELTGKKILDYEGNWRDIFQNWEATAHSYPSFIKGMIFKFLNASTFDGYNPYRVTKDGFDWETIEPDDPWSYIGYWGDHQVIYFLKFLEFAEAHQPGLLSDLFNKQLFVYANVPYEIRSYEDIVQDSKDTVSFNEEKDHQVRARREEIGSDGALLQSKKGTIYHVNFIEKLLAICLSKLSNFIPDGGIWMNTQRPEWNDANNALVGNGISMVTLYYLYRFIDFTEVLLQANLSKEVSISKEMVTFFIAVEKSFFEYNRDYLDNNSRKKMMDQLGKAGADYRSGIYQHSFSGKQSSLSIGRLSNFLSNVKATLETTIESNRREDGLYHAYNLIDISETEAQVDYLSEMLEGQVAVLSAKFLNGKETLQLLDALKNSKLFRKDQYSYILYPNKELPGFLEKNIISQSAIEKSTLLQQLISDEEHSIISKDVFGKVHFNGNFRNDNDLKEALQNLDGTKYGSLAQKESTQVLDIFEEVFNHKAFTGRSGTFFGYEGLGSIYWHMVSKLLLAVQEVCIKAIEDQEDPVVIGRLLEHFYEINEGIGVHKSPELYGAFPTDPYSHTPASKGAQQPGMTGQVKEDILSRFGELGIFVKDGQLSFNPCLLRKEEFLKEARSFHFVNLHSQEQTLHLDPNTLAFSYCQVPIVYTLGDRSEIKISYKAGTKHQMDGNVLDAEHSKEVFNRTDKITLIEVKIDTTILK